MQARELGKDAAMCLSVQNLLEAQQAEDLCVVRLSWVGQHFQVAAGLSSQYLLHVLQV
jgi:hypothetical protein